MFIQKMHIANYKCFNRDGMEFTFRVPNGEDEGSGLNIFVGENGTGKTSVLEAINMLTQSQYAIQNRLTVGDYFDIGASIAIKIESSNIFKYKMPDIFRGCYLNCNGIESEIKVRDRKSPGKLLSPRFSISSKVINTESKYRKENDEEGNEIKEFYRIFDDSKLYEPFNIFYFDKYRARQIQKGTFTTLYERIIEDLNWKYLKSLREHPEYKDDIKNKIAGEYFEEIIELSQRGVGEKIANDVKEFFSKDQFSKIKIDFINLLNPFDSSFFALRDENSVNQIPVQKLGSGIEMIFTLLLLKSISEQSKGSIIYLIDEPELSLYPQAQRYLLELLYKESKNNQIFLSTHSSYFTDPINIQNVFRFKLNTDMNVEVFKLNDKNVVEKLRENRNFFFRHRDLLYTDSAIFIEGPDDYERYIKYCIIKGFDKLIPRFYIMNGKDHTLFFERFCHEFNINHYAIVDKDYGYNRSKWSRQNRKRIVYEIKEFFNEYNVSYDSTKFDEAMVEELKKGETLKGGEITVELIENEDAEIAKIKDKNIFVLNEGEVEDYLDVEGKAVSTKKDLELLSIFNYIQRDILSKHK